MATKITFLGDVHADWQSLRWAMNQNPDTDMFICAGDFGIMPKCGGFPKQKGFGRPVYFIDGNHEDHALLRKRIEKGNLELARECWYIPRASSMVIDGVRINCIGGAESIDKVHRVEGVSWWKEEIASYEEMQKFVDLPAADIIVTHTAPMSVVQNSRIAQFKMTDPQSQMFDHAWQSLEYTPKLWFFGHFHKHFTAKVKGTHFQCLPCTHSHDEQAFAGVSVIVEDGKFLAEKP